MRYRGPLRLRLGIMRRAGTIPQPLSVTDIFFVRDALLSVWKGAVADEAASIAVHEINSSKAERLATFAETSEQTVGDGGTPSVLVNHIDEARFVGANFRALFRGYLNGGAVDWSASSDVRAALHPARVLAAPEVCQADAGRSAAGAWRTLNTNVAARRIPDFDARTMTVLERTRGRRQQRCVVFGSHHASQVLAKQSARLVRRWRPQTVLLETDAERLSDNLAPERTFTPRFQATSMGAVAAGALSIAIFPAFFIPLNLTLSALAYGWYINSFKCENVLCAKAARDVEATVILADWHWSAGRRDVVALARILDRLQYANQVNIEGSRMFLSALLSIAHPVLAPQMGAAHWRRWAEFEKEAKPHMFWVTSARNDLIASCVNARANNALLAGGAIDEEWEGTAASETGDRKVNARAANALFAAGTIGEEEEEEEEEEDTEEEDERDGKAARETEDRMVLVVGASHTVSIVDRLCSESGFESFFREGRSTNVDLTNRNYDFTIVPSVNEQLRRWF